VRLVSIILLPDKRYTRYRVPYDEGFLASMKAAIQSSFREWSTGYRAWHIYDSEVMTIGDVLSRHFDDFEIVIHGVHFRIEEIPQTLLGRGHGLGTFIGRLIHSVIGADSERVQIQRVEDLLGRPPTSGRVPRSTTPPTSPTPSSPDAGGERNDDLIEKYERLLARAKKLQVSAKKYRARSRKLEANIHTLVTLIYDAQRMIERGGLGGIEWRWQTILDTCSRLSLDPSLNIPPPPVSSSSGSPSSAHAVLCVGSNAPPEVVDAAYKALAKLHHPDRGGDVEKMKEINDAYRRLKG